MNILEITSSDHGPHGKSLPPGGILWWTLRGQWAAGLILLSLLTEAPRPALLGAALAFLGGTAMDRAQIRRLPWRRIDIPLLIVTAAAAATEMILGSGDPLSAVSVLVLGIQAVKFLLPKKARDGWQLCAISYLEFLAAAASTSEIQFAACAFLYLGLSAGAMWALQAEAAAEEQGEPAHRLRAGFAAKVLVLSTCAGFLVSAVLFAVTPRVGIGHILRRNGPTGGLTGFSGMISLRDVTGIKTDRRVVARVEFPTLARGLDPSDLYLRGIVYNVFDGSVWRRTAGKELAVPRSGFLYFLSSPAPRSTLSTAEITLEPIDSPVLFVYKYPVLIEGTLGEIRNDGRGSLFFPPGGRQATRYRIQFASETMGEASAGEGAYSDEDLLLPRGWDNIKEISARVTGPGRTDAEKAELARAYFQKEFRYSLDDPAPTLRHFLTVKKQGFCEHYASALCLVLRAAGIPARVAAGFLGGEWSGVGKYLIVRQSDAHAWTEAWIGGRWVTLDATPRLGERSPFFSRTGTVGIYLDWARQRWNKYVVNYSLRMQAEGVSGGIAALRRVKNALRRASAGSPFPGGQAGEVAAGILAALAVAAVGRWLLGGRSPARLAGRNGAPLPRRYAKLLRRLSSGGFCRAPGSTLEEMIGDAVSVRPALRGEAAAFLAVYHRDRFGGRPLSPGEVREAARLAKRLGREVPLSGAR